MPPRVLILVQSYPDRGGIAAIVEMLVPELSQRATVHVAAGECGEGAAERLGLPADRVHDLSTPRRCNPLVFPTSLGYVVVTARRLRRLLTVVKPDLIIAQDAMHTGPVAAVVGASMETTTVVMDHGTLTNLYDPRWPAAATLGMSRAKQAAFRLAFAANWPVRALAWRVAVNRSAEVWQVGNELESFFSRAGPRARRYRQLVPNDFEIASPLERSVARRELGVASDARVVNLVTRLEGEKGLGDIATALGSVLPRHSDATILVAGEGNLEIDFRRSLVAAGCLERVRFLGRLDRSGVAQLHAASDFHLYAGTLGCAVSIALLEALASGVVPVISDVPSLHRDLIRDSGFVFRAGDPEALASALDTALSLSPEELERRKAGTAADLGAWADPPLSELVDSILQPDHSVT